MYAKTAAIYDVLYAWKNYAAETRMLLRLLRGRLRPPGKRLLEVGCGTGRYLEHLRSRFQVEGLDREPGMLRAAGRRLPGVPLHRADMRDFDLGRRFDVVLCLFSSIGYAHGRRELRAAVRSMARHLDPGGILVVEPWLSFEGYRPHTIHAHLEKGNGIQVARMVTSLRRGRMSVMEMHHLVGTRDGVRHVVEHHELWMAPDRELRAAFTAAGLRVEHRAKGPAGRGLWIGVRPRR